MRILAGIAAVLLLVSCTSVSENNTNYSVPSDELLVSTKLETFGSAAAFDRYLKRVEQVYWKANRLASGARGSDILLASLQDNPIAYECLEEDCDREDLEEVIVTGSKVSNPSITNNQKIGVEEGDIIKQIDDYLIVLQDGRLFSINVNPGGNEGLALIDRHNVYRNSESDTWYDEMLVSGRRIVVTGYSYDAEASEITILTLDDEGRFELEDTFFIASDDYYSTDNYATRVVGDKFIVHTPIYLEDYDPTDALPWPVIRQWGKDVPLESPDHIQGLPHDPLIRAADIYRPVQYTISPLVHMVTICDIGGHRSGRQLNCRATAFVAPEGHEFYVSEKDVFVWTWPDNEFWRDSGRKCQNADHDRGPVQYADALPAMIFKVSIKDLDLTILEARGRPYDQFGIDTQRRSFRALIDLTPSECADWAETMYPSFFSVSTSKFRKRKSKRLHGDNTPFPGFSSDLSLKNRFTEDHLVYSLSEWRYYPARRGEPDQSAILNIVPVDKPDRLTDLKLGHSAIRLERLGDNAVVTGYKDAVGLSVSLLSLEDEPHLSSTIVLENRFESEGRSHAFNAIINRDNSAYLGIPTVKRPEKAGRWWWYSDSSDVSFLAMSSNMELADIGALTATERTEHEDYKCEVSCIDWYGNSRPVFTDNRIFALSGAELIEGRLEGHLIKEYRRINMTSPLPEVGLD